MPYTKPQLEILKPQVASVKQRFDAGKHSIECGLELYDSFNDVACKNGPKLMKLVFTALPENQDPETAQFVKHLFSAQIGRIAEPQQQTCLLREFLPQDAPLCTGRHKVFAPSEEAGVAAGAAALPGSKVYPTKQRALRGHACFIAYTGGRDLPKDFSIYDVYTVFDPLLLPEDMWLTGVPLRDYFGLVDGGDVSRNVVFSFFDVYLNHIFSEQKVIIQTGLPSLHQHLTQAVSLDFPVGSKVVEQGRGLDVVIVGYKCSTKQYLVKPTAGGEHGQADYLVSQELLKFKKVVVEEPFETNALDYYGALSPKIFSRFIKERTDSLMLALPKLRFTVKEVERALNFHLNICVLGETSDEADFVIEVSIRPSQLLEREDFIFVDLTYSSPLLNYRKQDLEKTRFLLSKQDVRKIKTAKQTSAEILSPQRQCLICCDLEAVYLVYPCGCYGLCGDCNEKAETRQGCPFCRQPTSTVAHKRDYLKFLAGTKITDHTGPMPDAEAAAASCASSKASTGSKCKVCGTPAKRNCSGCRTVVYCSAACQKSDWKSHKPVCKTHRAVASVNKKKPSK